MRSLRARAFCVLRASTGRRKADAASRSREPGSAMSDPGGTSRLATPRPAPPRSRHREEAAGGRRDPEPQANSPWAATLPAVARSDGGWGFCGFALYARKPFVCGGHQQEDARPTRQAGAANPAPQCLIGEGTDLLEVPRLPHPAAVIARRRSRRRDPEPQANSPWAATLPAVARSDGGWGFCGCALCARKPVVCGEHQQEDARPTRQAEAANPAPQCLIREEPAGWRRRALPHPAPVIARRRSRRRDPEPQANSPWAATLPAVARSDGGWGFCGCALCARKPFVCGEHQQEDARLTRQAEAANPAPQCRIREEPAGWRRRALPHPAPVIARRRSRRRDPGPQARSPGLLRFLRSLAMTAVGALVGSRPACNGLHST